MLWSILRTKPKVFRLLLASYLLVLLVPLVLGILLFRGVATAMREEALRARLTALQKGRDALDGELRALDTQLIELAQNQKVHALLSVDSALEGAGICKVLDAWQELSRARMPQGLVRDVFLYYGRSDVILSPSITYVRMACFDGTFFSCANQTFHQWKGRLSGDLHVKRWLPAETISFRGEEERVLTLVRSLPVGAGSIRLGAAMAFVRESAFTRLLCPVTEEASSRAFVVDGLGTVLAGGDGIRPVGSIPGQGPVRAARVGDLWWLTVDSQYSDWTYALAVPDTVVMARLHRVRTALLIGLLVLSLLGVAAATLLADWQTRPIREIVRALGKSLHGSERGSANEYERVRATVLHLLDGNRDLAKTLQRQTPLVRHSFLSRLVKGEIADRHEVEVLAAEAGVDLRGPRFLVLVAVFPMRGRLTPSELATLNVTRTALMATVERLLPSRTCVVETDVDQVGVVISLERDESPLARAEELASAVAGRAGGGPYAPGRPLLAAGTAVDDLMGICLSYANARVAARFASQAGPGAGEVVWFDDVPRDSGAYYYPLGIENRIIALTHQGDCDAIQDLLTVVQRENFERRRLSPAGVEQLFAEMAATVAKAADGANGDGAVALAPIARLTGSGDGHALGPSAQEVFSAAREAFRALCRGLVDRHRAHSRRLRDEVLDHIRASYADPNLCLQSIASRFRLSPFYVSQFFKDQAGENFHQYLERLRLEKACDLLRGTDLPIAEVARRSGYGNLSTFRKAFRRVVGACPREVRQNVSGGGPARAVPDKS